jgi:hypothetical protein
MWASAAIYCACDALSPRVAFGGLNMVRQLTVKPQYFANIRRFQILLLCCHYYYNYNYQRLLSSLLLTSPTAPHFTAMKRAGTKNIAGIALPKVLLREMGLGPFRITRMGRRPDG